VVPPQTNQYAGKPAAVQGGSKPALRTVGGKRVALTIDDGPDPTWTPRYLRLLAKLHIKAVFCLIGENVRRYPGLVKQIVAGGHTLCNHTMHHDLRIGRRSTATMHTDLTATTAAIVRASGGVRPVFFRARRQLDDPAARRVAPGRHDAAALERRPARLVASRRLPDHVGDQERQARVDHPVPRRRR
jgi:peptidoglycan/xylan/chitin deacetylase (PgdA/CDA1 family)